MIEHDIVVSCCDYHAPSPMKHIYQDAPLLADESHLDHEELLLQKDTLGDVQCSPPTSDYR